MRQTDGAPIRVLVVDDDPIVRETLRDYVASSEDIVLAGSAATGPAAVEWLGRHGAVDVVLMDVRMPDQDGLSAASDVRELHPDARVVLLTTFDAEDLLVDAIMAGVAGVILKSDGMRVILAAVRAAFHGTAVFSPGTVDRARAQQRPRAPVPVRLSEREQQVLELLCRAHPNAEIARRLYLSESRVKAVVSTLLSRFDAESRLEVVVRAFEWNLVGGAPPADARAAAGRR